MEHRSERGGLRLEQSELDRHHNDAEVLSTERESVFDNPLNAIFVVDRWQVKEMYLTPQKVKALWEKTQEHKTLFTDFTRDDPSTFVYHITNPDTYWLEIFEGKMLVGLICVMNFKFIDAEVHIMFFDRKPAEKVEVYRSVMAYLFENFPLQRITVVIPAIYFATIRLAERLGFRKEGTKRKAVLIGGNWIDQYIYGILRTELWA